MKSLKRITIIFILLFCIFEFGAFTICILVSLSKAYNYMTVSDADYSFFKLIMSCFILHMPAFLLVAAVYILEKNIKAPIIMLTTTLISVIFASITFFGIL